MAVKEKSLTTTKQANVEISEDSPIEKLTKIIIKNYFDASFDFDLKNGSFDQTARDKLIAKTIGKPYQSSILEKTSSRNILVIGAGASVDLYEDLLTAPAFKNHIKKSLGWNLVEYHANKRKEKAENDLLQLVYGIDPDIKRFFYKLLYDPEHTIDFKKSKISELGAGLGFSSEQIEDFKQLAITFLKDAKTLHEKLSNWLVEEEKILLSSHKDLDELDFELTLYLLSKTYSIRDIQNVIQDVYGDKNRPGLSYEIMAHMLKHRMIDVIVNFNFDELLDQAIEEEMGNSEYYRVLGDGDCEELKSWLINDKIKTPVYIKPHGTSSEKNSLRFTKEDYFRVPAKVQSLLQDIFSGSTKSNGNKDVNIITVGYGMASTEVNEILKKTIRTVKTNFFHINTSLKIIDDTKRYLEINEFEEKRLGQVDKTDLVNQYVIENQKSISNIFYTLYHGIRDGFQLGFKPHGIWRPEIICDLFYDLRKKKRVPSLESESAYCLFRALVEITINVAVNKGTVNIVEISSGHAGKYYSRFKKNRYLKSQNLASLSYCLEHYFGLSGEEFPYYKLKLKNITLDLGSSESIEKFVDELWLRLHSAINDVKSVVPEKEFDQFKKRLYIKKREVFVKKRLIELTKHSSYIVSPKFNDPYFNIHFHHEPERVLNTRLALKSSLSEAIERPGWDLMLMAARRGSLFLNSTFALPEDKKIIMVLSENDYKEKLKSKYSKFIHAIQNLDTTQMDFHMSLFLKLDSPKEEREPSFQSKYYEKKIVSSELGWSVSQAIYFRKYSDSSEINPISLNRENPVNIRGQENRSSSVLRKNPDRENLLSIFFRYMELSGIKKVDYEQWLMELSYITLDNLSYSNKDRYLQLKRHFPKYSKRRKKIV